jgi:trypsin
LIALGASGPAAGIVGGQPADPAVWPEIVALYESTPGATPWDEQFCAGTLVAPTKVITAAHCFTSGDRLIKNPATVRARVSDPTLGGDVGEEAGIADLAVPPLVRRPDTPDIAILTLDTPLSATPIEVPAKADWPLRAGAPLVTAGWGQLSSGGRFPTAIRDVGVQSVSPGTCRTLYPLSLFAPGFDACAGDVERGGRDTCQGDSGGPLEGRRPDGTWVLVGVTSRGDGCADPFSPGVYARPDRVADWLAAQGVPLAAPVVPPRGQADTRRPRIRVVDTTVRVGRPFDVRYSVTDNSRRTAEEIVVLNWRTGSAGFEATALGSAKSGERYFVRFLRRTPASFSGRTFVACATATDAAGNVSRRSCGRVKVRR